MSNDIIQYSLSQKSFSCTMLLLILQWNTIVFASPSYRTVNKLVQNGEGDENEAPESFVTDQRNPS